MAQLHVPPDFAKRAKAMVESAGGAAALAKASGVTAATLYNWMNGKAPQSAEQLRKVTAAAGVSFADMVGDVRSDLWRQHTIRRLRELLHELEEDGQYGPPFEEMPPKGGQNRKVK